MWKVVFSLAAAALFFSCAHADPPGIDPESLPPVDPTDPLDHANVIYLHHSTGGIIWDGGVPEGLDAYNTANGTDYTITQESFPIGHGNNPYDWWHIWVEHAGPTEWEGEATLEILTQTYNVIVFKHCYPVSDIVADSGPADVTSADQQIQNYQLQYNALKAKMLEFPNTRFIVWTGAARRQSETTADNAARANTFFTWVRDTWDTPGDNVYVWDFWTLETEGTNYLLPAHASGDSHPNGTFAAEVAPYFVNRLVDVIEGRGDTGSVTGN